VPPFVSDPILFRPIDPLSDFRQIPSGGSEPAIPSTAKFIVPGGRWAGPGG